MAYMVKDTAFLSSTYGMGHGANSAAHEEINEDSSGSTSGSSLPRPFWESSNSSSSISSNSGERQYGSNMAAKGRSMAARASVPRLNINTDPPPASSPPKRPPLSPRPHVDFPPVHTPGSNSYYTPNTSSPKSSPRSSPRFYPMETSSTSPTDPTLGADRGGRNPFPRNSTPSLPPHDSRTPVYSTPFGNPNAAPPTLPRSTRPSSAPLPLKPCLISHSSAPSSDNIPSDIYNNSITTNRNSSVSNNNRPLSSAYSTSSLSSSSSASSLSSSGSHPKSNSLETGSYSGSFKPVKKSVSFAELPPPATVEKLPPKGAIWTITPPSDPQSSPPRSRGAALDPPTLIASPRFYPLNPAPASRQGGDPQQPRSQSRSRSPRSRNPTSPNFYSVQPTPRRPNPPANPNPNPRVSSPPQDTRIHRDQRPNGTFSPVSPREDRSPPRLEEVGSSRIATTQKFRPNNATPSAFRPQGGEFRPKYGSPGNGAPTGSSTPWSGTSPASFTAGVTGAVPSFAPRAKHGSNSFSSGVHSPPPLDPYPFPGSGGTLERGNGGAYNGAGGAGRGVSSPPPAFPAPHRQADGPLTIRVTDSADFAEYPTLPNGPPGSDMLSPSSSVVSPSGNSTTMSPSAGVGHSFVNPPRLNSFTPGARDGAPLPGRPPRAASPSFPAFVPQKPPSPSRSPSPRDHSPRNSPRYPSPRNSPRQRSPRNPSPRYPSPCHPSTRQPSPRDAHNQQFRRSPSPSDYDSPYYSSSSNVLPSGRASPGLPPPARQPSPNTTPPPPTGYPPFEPQNPTCLTPPPAPTSRVQRTSSPSHSTSFPSPDTGGTTAAAATTATTGTSATTTSNITITHAIPDAASPTPPPLPTNGMSETSNTSTPPLFPNSPPRYSHFKIPQLPPRPPSDATSLPRPQAPRPHPTTLPRDISLKLDPEAMESSRPRSPGPVSDSVVDSLTFPVVDTMETPVPDLSFLESDRPVGSHHAPAGPWDVPEGAPGVYQGGSKGLGAPDQGPVGGVGGRRNVESVSYGEIMPDVGYGEIEEDEGDGGDKEGAGRPGLPRVGEGWKVDAQAGEHTGRWRLDTGHDASGRSDLRSPDQEQAPYGGAGAVDGQEGTGGERKGADGKGRKDKGNKGKGGWRSYCCLGPQGLKDEQRQGKPVIRKEEDKKENKRA